MAIGTEDIACDHCQARYRIPAEKIPAHGLTVKCRQCSRSFVCFRSDDFYANTFSFEVSRFLIARKAKKRSQQASLKSILLFEKFVNGRGRSARFASHDDMLLFFKLLKKKVPEEQIEQIREALKDFFEFLLKYGILSAERLEREPALFGMLGIEKDPEPVGSITQSFVLDPTKFQDYPIEDLPSPRESPPEGRGPERRRHPRFPFRSKSVLYTANGFQLYGETVDVAFEGILVRLCGRLPEVALGERGLLQVALLDFLPLETCFVTLPVQVSRKEREFFGLKMARLQGEMPYLDRVSGRVEVYQRRSSGALEPGWEVIHYLHPMPRGLHGELDRFRHFGLPVVSMKAGKKDESFLYKVVPIQELKKMQEMVHAESEEIIQLGGP